MTVLRTVPAEDAAGWRARAIRHLTDTRTRAEGRQPSPDTADPLRDAGADADADAGAGALSDPGGEFWLINSDPDAEHSQQTTPSWLWCVEIEGGVALGDLMLSDATRLPDVWPLIVELASERGWGRLNFSTFRHDPVSTGLAEQVASTLIATKMQLAVSDSPAPERIDLRPMGDSHFQDFYQRSLEQYAHELMETGSVTDPEAADRAATEAMTRLLPSGRDTPDQLFFTAHIVPTAHTAPTDNEDSPAIGDLWLALQPHDRAFVYDIAVNPDLRGQGFGTQLLHAAAAVTREHGRSVLALNVFGNNTGAHRLYQRTGFVTTESIRSVDLMACTTMPQGTGSSSGSET